MIALLLLIASSTAAMSSIATDEQVIALLYDYALSQNTMNATLAASLFATNGVAYMPSGSAAIVGQQNIYKAYSSLFSNSNYVIERCSLVRLCACALVAI
jgi:hypothetical protein